jgi:hypothetical protein
VPEPRAAARGCLDPQNPRNDAIIGPAQTLRDVSTRRVWGIQSSIAQQGNAVYTTIDCH